MFTGVSSLRTPDPKARATPGRAAAYKAVDHGFESQGGLGPNVTVNLLQVLGSFHLKQEGKPSWDPPSHLENPYVAEHHKVEPILKVELQV